MPFNFDSVSLRPYNSTKVTVGVHKMAADLLPYLPGKHKRARVTRQDAAKIIKRFLMCERALIINQAAWLPAIAPLEVKLALPRMLWEDAMAANTLRQRLLELQYPSQTIEAAEDTPLIQVFEETLHAPSPEAFVLSMARLFKPALLQAYQQYVATTDELADAPTVRLLRQAILEKREQVQHLTRYAGKMLVTNPTRRAEAETWVTGLNRRLIAVGGLSMAPPLSPGAWGHSLKKRDFALTESPARDTQFNLCRFYWPTVLNPDFNNKNRLHTQLQNAVTQFNQVWAVELAGSALFTFAKKLDWDFIFDAARWAFDESRHCRMGYERLHEWGFKPSEIPLGSYINDSLNGQDPVYKLGMLCHLETKHNHNLSSIDDRVSRHDMEFDEADETLHGYFGQRWLTALHTTQPDTIPDPSTVKSRCDALIEAILKTATETDRHNINQIAAGMITKAEMKVGEPA